MVRGSLRAVALVRSRAGNRVAMRRGFSCYLDLARVVACMIVFAHHLTLDSGCYDSTDSLCTTLAYLIPFHAGHSAVVIFFVLSGYVITYVASERETSPDPESRDKGQQPPDAA